MGPSAHAKLSPSASERWISCPASIRMEAAFPEDKTESPYAVEGTAAHALAEIRASVRFGHVSEVTGAARVVAWESEFPQHAGDDDMERHVEAYLDFLSERLAYRPHSVILLEQRLPTGVPTCWGTSDAVIVSTTHVEIVDFKYGRGVRVEAEGNSQVKLYGVGALEEFGDLLGDAEEVIVSIFQPRLRATSSHSTPAAELRRWRDKLIPIANLALGPDAPFGPSEKACRWCPASGRCRAQLEQVFRDADYEVTPDTLTPGEIAEVLTVAPAIKQWLLDLEKAALTMAYSDKTPIPGYKVVMSGGRRAIQDEEGATHALSEYASPLGERLPPESYTKPPALRGIGELEKLLGDEFSTVLGDYIVKNEGRPSLAKESDRRPSISPDTEAQKEFSK